MFHQMETNCAEMYTCTSKCIQTLRHNGTISGTMNMHMTMNNTPSKHKHNHEHNTL